MLRAKEIIVDAADDFPEDSALRAAVDLVEETPLQWMEILLQKRERRKLTGNTRLNSCSLDAPIQAI